MSDFSLSSNGYNIGEVENFINKLKNDYEAKLAEQKDRIFYLKDQVEKLTTSSEGELMATLVKSVERAKQIEMSSKNIYELETKRLQLLYMKMEGVVEEITMSHSPAEIKTDLLRLIEEFKDTLNQNIILQAEGLAGEYADPVRRLLSKMTINRAYAATAVRQEPTPAASEVQNVAEKQPISKPVLTERPKPVAKPAPVPSPTPLSNLLKEDSTGGTNFESIMFKKTDNKRNSVVTAELAYPTPNDSGFDLKAAVNPTDDLEEIMKAFDFFDEDFSKKKKK